MEKPCAASPRMDHASSPLRHGDRPVSPSRYSPVAPLAPLEFLQNQRRGSITDPSLHASAPPPSSLSTQSSSATPTPSSSSGPPAHSLSGSSRPSSSHASAAAGAGYTPPSHSSRPTSPYVFGDASHSSVPEHGSPHLRRVLRSPMPAEEKPPHGGQAAHLAKHPDVMDVDFAPRVLNNPRQSVDSGRGDSRDRFDYSLRRHSIAVGESGRTVRPHPDSGSASLSTHRPSMSPHGVKRKISPERNAFPPVGEEGPAPMNVDSEGHVTKRRGSAFDTQRISHLNIYERRDSLESLTSRASQLWVNDRRPSTSSLLSNPSLGSSSPGGYTSSSVFSSDSPHGKPPASMASFAWPTAGQQSSTEPPLLNAHAPPPGGGVGSLHPNNISGHGRPSLTQSVSPLSQDTAMSQTMTIDRRQSAPEVGPVRNIRARSRPPSRSGRGSLDLSAASHDDYLNSPSEKTATPYSRSPELRVSHKLAERKRRKEMKDLFDELRDQLPADRGMKASKWEILSKAIDFIQNLKAANTELARENDILRHENDGIRQGIAYAPGAHQPHHIIYAPPPAPVVPGAFAPQPTGPPQQQQVPPHPLSRPGSSHNIYANSQAAPPSTVAPAQSAATPHSSGASRNGTPTVS